MEILVKDPSEKNMSSIVKEEIYTPASLINIFNNSLRASTDNKIQHVRGIYQRVGKEEYGGKYYDYLIEEVSEERLTIRIPISIRNNVNSDHVYIFKGYLNRNVRNDSSINLVFNVQTCISEMERQISYEDMKKTDLLSERQNKGYRNVLSELENMISKNKRPVINLIYGKNAVTDKDVEQNLAEFVSSKYTLQKHKINLFSSMDVCKTLRAINKRSKKNDVIAIVRGGGSGLEIFDDIQIGKTAATLKCMLVTAIGHAVDISFLDKMADKYFTTPTEFAKALESVVKRCLFKEQTQKQKVKQKKLLALLFAALLAVSFLSGYLIAKQP